MTRTKGFFKFLLPLLLCLAIALAIGTALLTAVYCIPAEAMEENVYESAQVLHNEGLYPWPHSWCTSMVDNFTDSFMLLHAAYQNDRSPLDQAMNIYRPYFEVKDMPYQDLMDHYIEGKEYLNEYTYERYWHGYLVYLKPLLCIMNYDTIRTVNGIFQTLLLVLVVALLVKNKMKRYIPAYLVAVGLLLPTVTAMCLQYSSCYYAMTFGIIALLLSRDKLEQRESFIFLFLGIFVAYVDFLTYPIVTLGMPLAVYYAMDRGGNLKRAAGKMGKLCFCWGLGYGGMWAGKWVLGSLLTGNNQLSGAMNKVAERTAGDVYGEAAANPALKAWTDNWEHFSNTPFYYLMWAVTVLAVVVFLVRLVQKKIALKQWKAAVPFAVITCMPLVWYAVLANHSIMHCWFTFKSLVVLGFGLMCLGLKLTEQPE